jgi:hypothetical protein
MGLEDITKSITSLSDVIADWLRYLRHPLKCCEELLRDLQTEEEKIKRGITNWATTFVMTLIILLPIYYLIGIDLKKVEFFLPAFLILFLNFLFYCVAIQVGFRRTKIQSLFSDTFLIYSVTTSCYTPLYNLIGFPTTLRLLTTLRDTKILHLGLQDTIKTVYLSLSSSASLENQTFIILSLFLIPLCCIPLVLFAEAASKHYAVSRQKIFSSLTFSVAVIAQVPCAALLFLYYVIIYIFASGPTPK